MSNSYLSLFKLKRVYPGEGCKLQDLIVNKEYLVKEGEITSILRTGSVFSTRIFHFEGINFMGRCLYPYYPESEEYFLMDIEDRYYDFEEDNPYSPVEVFLKNNINMFLTYWLEENFEDEME